MTQRKCDFQINGTYGKRYELNKRRAFKLNKTIGDD